MGWWLAYAFAQDPIDHHTVNALFDVLSGKKAPTAENLEESFASLNMSTASSLNTSFDRRDTIQGIPDSILDVRLFLFPFFSLILFPNRSPLRVSSRR